MTISNLVLVPKLGIIIAGVCKEYCVKHSRGGLLPGSSGTHWQQAEAKLYRSSRLDEYTVECGCPYSRPITSMPMFKF